MQKSKFSDINRKKLSIKMPKFFLLIFKLNISLALIVSLALVISLGSNPVFAELTPQTLGYINALHLQFQKNLKYPVDGLNPYDTKAGGSWKLIIPADQIQEHQNLDLLLGIYSVIPFATTLNIKTQGESGQISIINDSKYTYEHVIRLAKIWNSQIITSDMDDFQKVVAIHDKIINEVSYDEQGNDESHSPAGAIIEKSAVCDGYSRLFYIMATLEDLKVIHVTANNMVHAFNLVYIDGRWLIVDTTYDDPVTLDKGPVLSYQYMLIDIEDSDRHIFDNESQGLTKEEYIQIANHIYFETQSILDKELNLDLQDSSLNQVRTKALARTAKINLNKSQFSLPSYNIDGYNYIALRDLAYILQDTGSEFAINLKSNIVSIDKYRKYKPTGKELIPYGNSQAIATKVSDIAYNINNKNYLKLQDLSQLIGFELEYNQKTGQISIVA